MSPAAAAAKPRRMNWPSRGHATQVNLYATVTAFDNARLAEAWDAALPDENTAYYLKRLDECARRFAPFFTVQDFARVFAPEDLFGFSPAGIRVQTTLREGSPT